MQYPIDLGQHLLLNPWSKLKAGQSLLTLLKDGLQNAHWVQLNCLGFMTKSEHKNQNIFMWEPIMSSFMYVDKFQKQQLQLVLYLHMESERATKRGENIDLALMLSQCHCLKYTN